MCPPPRGREAQDLPSWWPTDGPQPVHCDRVARGQVYSEHVAPGVPSSVFTIHTMKILFCSNCPECAKFHTRGGGGWGVPCFSPIMTSLSIWDPSPSRSPSPQRDCWGQSGLSCLVFENTALLSSDWKDAFPGLQRLCSVSFPRDTGEVLVTSHHGTRRKFRSARLLPLRLFVGSPPWLPSGHCVILNIQEPRRTGCVIHHFGTCGAPGHRHLQLVIRGRPRVSLDMFLIPSSASLCWPVCLSSGPAAFPLLTRSSSLCLFPFHSLQSSQGFPHLVCRPRLLRASCLEAAPGAVKYCFPHFSAEVTSKAVRPELSFHPGLSGCSAGFLGSTAHRSAF